MDHSQVLSDTLALPIVHLLCSSQTLTLALLEYGFSRLEGISRIICSNPLMMLQFPLGHVCQNVIHLYLSIFRGGEISPTHAHTHPAFMILIPDHTHVIAHWPLKPIYLAASQPDASTSDLTTSQAYSPVLLTPWLGFTLVSVKEKLTADPDSEVATTSLRVSLMCPVGTREKRRGRRAWLNLWPQNGS